MIKGVAGGRFCEIAGNTHASAATKAIGVPTQARINLKTFPGARPSPTNALNLLWQTHHKSNLCKRKTIQHCIEHDLRILAYQTPGRHCTSGGSNCNPLHRATHFRDYARLLKLLSHPQSNMLAFDGQELVLVLHSQGAAALV
ncbi:MAG: hypothetical protein WBY53_10875 [Acidobacteriaceae bacterium]